MALANPFAQLPADAGAILVVTGERDAGKTTLCQRVVAQYRQAGLKVAGLLSPGRFTGGEKIGFDVVDLATGESRLLASAIEGEMVGFRFGPRWTFDPDVLEWGNRRLKQSAEADLLVIDEIGPLEFDHKMGWIDSFEVLARGNYRRALVVIRPEYVRAFAQLGFSFQVLEVARE